MSTAQLLAAVVVTLASAVLFKLSVALFSPRSPNSLLRAVVTGALATLAAWAVLVLFAKAPPLLVLILSALAPLWVVKRSYAMGLFRALVVTLFYGLLWSLAWGLLVGDGPAQRLGAPASPITIQA